MIYWKPRHNSNLKSGPLTFVKSRMPMMLPLFIFLYLQRKLLHAYLQLTTIVDLILLLMWQHATQFIFEHGKSCDLVNSSELFTLSWKRKIVGKTSLKSLSVRKLLDQSAFAYWVLLVHSGSFWFHLCPSGFLQALLVLAATYWSLLVLTGPYWALLGLTGPYLALPGLTGPYCDFFKNNLTD